MNFGAVYTAVLTITWGICITLYYFTGNIAFPHLGNGLLLAIALYGVTDLVREYKEEKVGSHEKIQ